MAQVSATIGKVTELRKQPAVSGASIQQFIAKVKGVKAHLLTVTGKKLRLLERLSTVDA